MDWSPGGVTPQAAPERKPAGPIVESSTASFQADVIDASQEVPVLVDFWAPWCGPCRQLTPTLEKVVTALAGKIRLVKINVDDNQALAGQLGVQSIPAVLAFLGGRPVDGFMGAVSEAEVQRFAQRLVDAAARAGLAGEPQDENAQIEAALDAAEAAREAGDVQRADQIYQVLLQHAPEHPRVLLGVARSAYEAGDLDAATQTLARIPEAGRTVEGYEALQKALALAGEAGALGEAAPLEARLEADPSDHQARFDLALVLNAQGEHLQAAQELVEIMRRDREWAEDGARKKLLELFEAWGPKDPATAKGRRLLSSVLFR